MKHCMLLSLLLALGCTGAPVDQDVLEQGSCDDGAAGDAAGLALTKINQDRQEGYIFRLHRLSNVHMTKHAMASTVYYLTLDVVETNCSVLSKKDWKTCEARPTTNTPVYGQCKAVLYISKVQRVVRLYKYDCVVRPVPAARVNALCPDCPSLINMDNAEIQKTLSLSLEKFNDESGLAHRFALLNITRAAAGMAMSMYYNVEYTIQETTCPNSEEAVATDKCPLMGCEFAHKGFCKASLFDTPTGNADTSVDCEIYEPQAADRQKRLHLLGGETDHSHSQKHDYVHSANDTHTHDHDAGHGHAHNHSHDHVHDHTKSHAHHNRTHKHGDGRKHHHTHDHEAGHRHAHNHSHDHVHDHTKSHAHHNRTHKHGDDSKHHHTHEHDAGHDHEHDHSHSHDHVHTHHAKAHNHSGDSPHHHHDYKHGDGVHTHEHDHELALDHDHKHAHLHVHEHHHHHHEHDHENSTHKHPKGTVRTLPAMGQPTTLPAFPDVPADGPEVGVTLPLQPEPRLPGVMEPIIQAFPTSVSAQCSAPVTGPTLVESLFSEDPMFKPAA